MIPQMLYSQKEEHSLNALFSKRAIPQMLYLLKR